MIWQKKVTKRFTLELSEQEVSQLNDILVRAEQWQCQNYHLERYELEEKLQKALKEFLRD